jgi:Secretion system C-terminal sorting domain
MKLLQLIFVLFFSISSISQTLQNRVLIVKNTNSTVSIAVTDDYMLRRNVTKVLNVSCQNSALSSAQEWMSFSDYNSTIKTPLTTYLISHPEIDFIILTKGIPNKIYGAPNKPYGGDCAVDSLIASLGYETSPSASIVDFNIPDNGSFFTGQAYANKYWNSQVGFSHAAFGGYLVTRLDGYTQADAIALTTRSLLAEANVNVSNSETILLDACGSFGFDSTFTTPNSIFPANYVAGQTISLIDDYPYSNFNSDILLTKNQLEAAGNSVFYDDAPNFIGSNNLNGYVSWGSNDTNYSATTYNALTFKAGAIAETAVSTGARTFLPTSDGQSLIANLISQGVTGVKGYAVEPLLLGVGSPSILFDRYTKGWTMAESFYASAKLVGWMDVMIGDPICKAYANPLSIKQYNSNNNNLVYPNPSSDFIKINTPENTSIAIFDILGKSIVEIENYKSNSDIDITSIKSGIYFIELKNTKSYVLKFIKK